MARRAAEWSEGLAKDLKDVKFARAFVQAALEEGLSLQMVLGKVIRAYGIKEFSKKTKLPPSNILRAIHPKHNPTQETLNRLLRPLRLKLSVSSLKAKSNKTAA